MPNIATMSAPLSAAQVAQAHGLAKRTVLLEIARGRLRAHKLPGRTGAWIITAEDAATWAATRNASS